MNKKKGGIFNFINDQIKEKLYLWSTKRNRIKHFNQNKNQYAAGRLLNI